MQLGERTAEIPWMCVQLQKYKGRVLDIGSGGTDLQEFQRQKRKVVRVDKMFEQSDEANGIYACDIRDLSPDVLGYFGVVTIISTLEHIALDAYNYKDRGKCPWIDQFNALMHCSSFVKVDGVVLLTIPYGKEEDGGWYLVYDANRLDNLKRPYDVIKEDYFSLDFDTWTYNHVSREKCHDLGADWVRPDFSRASNVACLVLRRKDTHV
jgi:hypothetical protein